MADACVIGVDLGGTKLLAGTVDAELRVHHRAYRLSRRDAVVETIVEAVEEAREATRGEVRAVGVGVPCVVAPASGLVMACNHFPLVDVPLRDLLAERIGLPVVVDNDANAALVAEWRHGAARGARNVVVLTIGTGIGGGIVLDGRLLDGRAGNAGHIGHVVVEPDGRPCFCGGRGCLEGEASGRAIEAITGRPAAEAPPEIIERSGTLVGRAVASVANLLDLRLAVSAGSVALGFGEPFFAAAQAEVDALARLDFSRGAVIGPAGLGGDAPLVGAAAVALYRLGKLGCYQ
jgi:glucokinase